MRALTLTQPWATLVAIGAKLNETRSWGTAHRGVIAIHAAKGFPREAREVCSYQPFARVLEEAVIRELPLGKIIAVANLVRVVRTEDAEAAIVATPEVWPPHELQFGDYSPGRWAWAFEEVRQLRAPIPAKGALGLWELEPADELLLEAQLGAEAVGG